MEMVSLTISIATLNVVGIALQDLPYKVAAPAIQEIQAQVQAHQAAKEAAKPVAEKPSEG